MMIPIETIEIIRLYHWYIFASCEYCFFHVCESNKRWTLSMFRGFVDQYFCSYLIYSVYPTSPTPIPKILSAIRLFITTTAGNKGSTNSRSEVSLPIQLAHIWVEVTSFKKGRSVSEPRWGPPVICWSEEFFTCEVVGNKRMESWWNGLKWTITLGFVP